MAKRGRPTLYNDAVTNEICSRLSSGDSLITICKDKHMPVIETVRTWLGQEDKQDFTVRYARARQEQADHYADEMLAIARDEPDVNRARLQIDTRKWIASKLKPKKYGDKITQEHTGNIAVIISSTDNEL